MLQLFVYWVCMTVGVLLGFCLAAILHMGKD